MATTVTLGKLRFDWRGDFTLINSYIANDVVTYRSQQYIAIASNPVGTAGDRTPVNTLLWSSFSSVFNNRGTWASGNTYLPGDVVLYTTPGVLRPTNANFSLSRSVVQAYMCVLSNTSTSIITPIDAGYWAPINRKSALGLQTAPSETTGAFQLGIYGNSPYAAIGFANRGIMFDSSSNYKSGGYKNNTDSYGGTNVILQNGQVVAFGGTTNSSSPAAALYTNSQTIVTFPFYDWVRSTSHGGTGVHSTPDNEPPRAIQVEQNYHTSLVLMNSGEVFSWGYNGQGQLGNASTTAAGYAVRVGGTNTNVFAANASHMFAAVRIKRIAMGGGDGSQNVYSHCMALDEAGNLYTWGYNAYSQLGDGLSANVTSPKMIPRASFGNQSVIAMWACGSQYGWSFAVTQDNQLWAWGYNGQGQLGLGDTSNRLVPTLVTSTVAFGSAGIGNIVKIQFSDNVSDGGSAILTSKGLIYTAGNNGSGWMGNSNTTQKTTWTNMGSGPGSSSVSNATDMWIYGTGATQSSLMIRDALGACFTVGYNNVGQLGLGGTGVVATSTVAITKMQIAGTLYNLTNVKQLAWTGTTAATTTAVTVVTDSGIAFSIGYNTNGQASNGATGTQAGNYGDANGIENINSYVWQPVRSAPGMQGRMDDCIGFGMYNMAWRNSDGRWMVTGYANQYNTGSYHAATTGDTTTIMTTIPLN